MTPKMKNRARARRSGKSTQLAEHANSAAIRQATSVAGRKGIPAPLQTIRPVSPHLVGRDGRSSPASILAAVKAAIARLFRQERAGGHRLVSGS